MQVGIPAPVAGTDACYPFSRTAAFPNFAAPIDPERGFTYTENFLFADATAYKTNAFLMGVVLSEDGVWRCCNLYRDAMVEYSQGFWG